MFFPFCCTVPDTWGPVLREAVEKKDVDVIPYELELDYDYWSHRMARLIFCYAVETCI